MIEMISISSETIFKILFVQDAIDDYVIIFVLSPEDMNFGANQGISLNQTTDNLPNSSEKKVF